MKVEKFNGDKIDGIQLNIDGLLGIPMCRLANGELEFVEIGDLILTDDDATQYLCKPTYWITHKKMRNGKQ